MSGEGVPVALNRKSIHYKLRVGKFSYPCLFNLLIYSDMCGREFSLLLQHVKMALENMFARRDGICSTECRLGAALQVGAGEVDSAHAQAQLAECQGRGL